MSTALWVMFWAGVLMGILLAGMMGCVGDVEVRSDGDLTCEAPLYDVTAFSCNFDLNCNAKDVDAVDITNSDWECRCNIIPRQGRDLRLDCSLTSTKVEI